jgi:hypothetical protein
MLLTALPPAPPTPKTVIRGFNSVESGTVNLIGMALHPIDIPWECHFGFQITNKWLTRPYRSAENCNKSAQRVYKG